MRILVDQGLRENKRPYGGELVTPKHKKSHRAEDQHQDSGSGSAAIAPPTLFQARRFLAILIFILPLAPFLISTLASIWDLFVPSSLSTIATTLHPISATIVGYLLQPGIAPVGSRITVARADLQDHRIAIDDLFIALHCCMLGLQVAFASLTILCNGRIVMTSVRFLEGDFASEHYDIMRTNGLLLLGIAGAGLIDLTHIGFSFSYFEVDGANHLLPFGVFLGRSALVFTSIGIFLTAGTAGLAFGSLAIFAGAKKQKPVKD